MIFKQRLTAPLATEAAITNFFVHGVLKGVKQDEHQLVIAHEAIPNFMDAMTMPFNVKDAGIFTNVAIGEKITFQLHLTQTESWIDHMSGSPFLSPQQADFPPWRNAISFPN